MTEAKMYVKHLDNKSTMNLKIFITKEFKVRMFIGIQLLKLAARIMKCDIHIDTEKKRSCYVGY